MKKPKFVIFLHGGTYDKLHQAATIGLTAAAMGKEVYVFLMFWAIKKLASGEIDTIDFPPAYAAHAGEVARADACGAWRTGALAVPGNGGGTFPHFRIRIRNC